MHDRYWKGKWHEHLDAIAQLELRHEAYENVACEVLVTEFHMDLMVNR